MTAETASYWLVFNEGIFSNAGNFSRGELIHIKLLKISSNKDVKAQEDREQSVKSILWEIPEGL